MLKPNSELIYKNTWLSVATEPLKISSFYLSLQETDGGRGPKIFFFFKYFYTENNKLFTAELAH
jgi:hypothetical protein